MTAFAIAARASSKPLRHASECWSATSRSSGTARPDNCASISLVNTSSAPTASASRVRSTMLATCASRACEKLCFRERSIRHIDEMRSTGTTRNISSNASHRSCPRAGISDARSSIARTTRCTAVSGWSSKNFEKTTRCSLLSSHPVASSSPQSHASGAQSRMLAARCSSSPAGAWSKFSER